MNFKTNATKLIARVLVLVLLVTSAFSFAGCAEPHVKKGQYYTENGPPYFWDGIALKVVSDTKNFELDNVTLQLYFGLRPKDVSWVDWFFNDENKSNNTTEESIKIPDSYKNYCYLLYTYDYRLVMDEDGIHIIDIDIDFNHENLHILKEISYEESLTDERYTYARSPKEEYYFNYSQTITIPEDTFLGNSGTIYIVIAQVEKFDAQNVKYSQPYDKRMIGMSYLKADDGTVELSFRFHE